MEGEKEIELDDGSFGRFFVVRKKWGKKVETKEKITTKGDDEYIYHRVVYVYSNLIRKQEKSSEYSKEC